MVRRTVGPRGQGAATGRGIGGVRTTMSDGNTRDEVSKRVRRTANQQLGKIESDVAGYVGRCLFVVDDNGSYCNEPVSNSCHIVSESTVLHALRDNKSQEVLELNWGLSEWRRLVFSGDVEQRVQSTDTFDPSPKTTHDACVGWFACKPELNAHDNEFQPIDVADPDFDDPEVRFLAGYRSVLYLFDQYRLAMEFYQLSNQDVMRNSKRDERALWRGENEKLAEASRRLEPTVKLLGKNWYARNNGGNFDPDIVSAQVLSFRSELRLAGCVFYGKYVALSVLPAQDDWHKLGILYLTSESDLAGEDITRLEAVARASEGSDNYGVTVTNELMTTGWGTLAVSPASYEGLNDRDRFSIRSLIARHTRDKEPLKSIIQRTLDGRRR